MWSQSIVVASNGGAPAHPFWYRNLTERPDVTVQVRDRVYPAMARTASGSERERLWTVAAAQWPNYNVYVTRTDREIPVVVLSPASS